MVSWFGPQNQADYGLSVASQNQREGDGVEHVSRSSCLFCMEVSRTRVFQSSFETSGGTTVDGARGNIAEVASRLSQR
jgi:hypothetical protein